MSLASARSRKHVWAMLCLAAIHVLPVVSAAQLSLRLGHQRAPELSTSRTSGAGTQHVEAAPLPVGPCLDESLIDPLCGANGDPDGGCDAFPSLFVPVQCGDTICGTSAYNGTVGDTDWFNLGPVPVGTTVIWRGTTTFPAQPTIYLDDGACNVLICATKTVPPGAFEVCCTVPPGASTFVYLTMAPAPGSPPFACGATYFAEVLCSAICPCNAIHEELIDPACGQVSPDPDGGCNAVPPAFIAVQCGDRVCGTVWSDGVTRDTDWFDLGVVPPNTQVTWSGVAMFDSQPLIIAACPDCSSSTIVAGAFFSAGPFSVQGTPACPSVCPTRVLLWMGPQFTPYPCGTEYQAQVECQQRVGECPCQGSEDIQEWLLETCCGVSTDTTNGGCNSSPPVFTPINCGQTVCGSYAFDLAVRDTDWFAFTTLCEGTIDWTVTGQDLMDVAILELAPDCNNIIVRDFVSSTVLCAPITATYANAPPGRYVAFAAPSFGSFVIPCNNQYQGALAYTGGPFQSCLGNLLSVFGRCQGQPGYDPAYDYNKDGCINQIDLGILLPNQGACLPGH